MKNISLQFNKFYHSAVLTDIYKKSNSLVFKDLLDTRTGKYFVISKYEDYQDMDELKQLFKILNVNYSVDEEKEYKISTKDIKVKPLLEHIEYVIKVGIDNNIELGFVQEEWSRLLNEAKNYKIKDLFWS